MRYVLATLSALSLLVGLTARPAGAHEANQVQHELRQQGYYNIQFIVAEPPFQANACRDGERFHLHVDFYGRVTERSSVGRCRGHWGFNRRDADDRYRRY